MHGSNASLRERGVQLFGGQRQRNAIARAVAVDLVGQAPAEAIDTLSARLQAAQRAAARRAILSKEIEEDRAQRQATVTSQESASEALRALLEQAQVADKQALAAAIDRSTRYRAFKKWRSPGRSGIFSSMGTAYL